MYVERSYSSEMVRCRSAARGMRVLLVAACAVIACSAPRAADAALTVYNPNAKPIRLAQGPDGKIYVTEGGQ